MENREAADNKKDIINNMVNLTMTKDDLIKAMGIRNIDPEVQTELVTILSENVIKAVTLEVLRNLKDDERQEFEMIAINEDEQKLLSFFKKKVPQLDSIVRNKTDEQIAAVKNTVSTAE